MNEQEQALAGEIISDAGKRAERIKQRADAEARKIIADAQKEAEAAGERAVQDAAQRASRRQEVNRAHVEQDLVKLRLQWRQALLDRVRAEVEQQLTQLSAGSEHRQALSQLALLAIKAMSGERFQLVLRPEDRRSCGEALAAELAAAGKELGRDIQVELAEETLNATGGLIVKSPDGHQVADQTFEARLDRLWDQIRAELADMLPSPPGEAR